MRPTALRRLFAVLLAWLPLAALAEPVGFATGDRDLYRINLATGQATLVGSTGFVDVEGLAFAPDGTLYGAVDFGVPSTAPTDFLVRINTSTGAATAVGQLSGLQGLGPTGNLDYGLAFTCDGRLWLSSDTTRQLWEVNPATAQTRLVGALPAAISGLAARGNILFGLSVEATPRLFRIDQETAAATVVGVLALADVMYDAGLDFDADGRLWATIDYFTPPSGVPPLRNDIAEIDPATGQILALRAISGAGSGIGTVQMEGLAIAPTGGCRTGPGAPEAIPGPGLPLLLLLGLLAAGVGMRQLACR
jgi:hypothetical protein